MLSSFASLISRRTPLRSVRVQGPKHGAVADLRLVQRVLAVAFFQHVGVLKLRTRHHHKMAKMALLGPVDKGEYAAVQKAAAAGVLLHLLV